jgi:hypothetical protein
MNGIQKIQKFILTALLVTMLALVSSAPVSASQGPTVGWLSLTSTVSGCTWTVNVAWAGFKGAKTLEAYVTQTYTGAPLVPASVPVNKSGTATVTLAPLAPSATMTNFYAWAQLLDAHGNPIPGSLDFASVSPAYCTAP